MTMKTLMTTAMRFAAVSALAGCASVYRVSESAPGPESVLPPAPAKPIGRRPVVAVAAIPSDPMSKRLAAMLKSSAEGRLATHGFDVAPKRKPDFSATLTVSLHADASIDDWHVYEGAVGVSVMDAKAGRIVDNTMVKAKGARGLGTNAAEENIGQVLEPKISEWLLKTIPAKRIPVPVGTAPNVAVMMLTLSPADRGEPQEDVLVVQRRFMDAVNANPGVISCRLAKEIPASRAFVFRVDYYPEDFPGGLLNTLVLDGPDLGGARLEIVR